jgi:Family of unknown function (DUF695)/Regulator of ribonuclease activity B
VGYFYLLYHVKYFIAFQLLVCLLLCSAVHAQVENWDTYIAKFGDKPGSVLVDMGLKSVAPDTRYPYLVVSGPKVHNCNEQGLPDKEDIPSLEEVLEATSNFITGVTAKVLAGTLTYNCQRLNYYYVKDTTGIRNAIGRMYSRTFPNFSYVISIRPDAEWIEYRTFLYPSEATRNWMDNSKIITQMKQDGDSLSRPKDITFDLYFRADTGRTLFMNFAATKGYKTEPIMNHKATNAPYELLATKTALVKMAIIDSLSNELRTEAKKHNGFYSGWSAK